MSILSGERRGGGDLGDYLLFLRGFGGRGRGGSWDRSYWGPCVIFEGGLGCFGVFWGVGGQGVRG